MILIYDDGVFNNTTLIRGVQAVTNAPVAFCSATDIINGYLGKARLLIMPGGADLYFCEKLNGEGNQRIRDFVANGGSYLGICAGAYYGCAELDWACGEIAGERELAFYSGKATGPVYNWIENAESVYSGSWIKAVEMETDNGAFLTQYNGGPVFNINDESTILARYNGLKDQPPAIIAGDFGKGRYILSSPHIEKFGHLLTDGLYKHMNNSYEREKAEIVKLLRFEKHQKEFFKTTIERLL
jgi:glutamine amidotransferase-like uncharacterized protein